MRRRGALDPCEPLSSTTIPTDRKRYRLLEDVADVREVRSLAYHGDPDVSYGSDGRMAQLLLRSRWVARIFGRLIPEVY